MFEFVNMDTKLAVAATLSIYTAVSDNRIYNIQSYRKHVLCVCVRARVCYNPEVRSIRIFQLRCVFDVSIWVIQTNQLGYVCAYLQVGYINRCLTFV